mgnify:CR=1 FL=1
MREFTRDKGSKVLVREEGILATLIGNKDLMRVPADVGELSLIFLKQLIYGLYLRVDALTGIDHG